MGEIKLAKKKSGVKYLQEGGQPRSALRPVRSVNGNVMLPGQTVNISRSNPISVAQELHAQQNRNDSIRYYDPERMNRFQSQGYTPDQINEWNKELLRLNREGRVASIQYPARPLIETSGQRLNLNAPVTRTAAKVYKAGGEVTNNKLKPKPEEKKPKTYIYTDVKGNKSTTDKPVALKPGESLKDNSGGRHSMTVRRVKHKEAIKK